MSASALRSLSLLFLPSFGSFAIAKGSRGERRAAAPAARPQPRTWRRVAFVGRFLGALLMGRLRGFESIRGRACRAGSVVGHELGGVAERPEEVFVPLLLLAARVDDLHRALQFGGRRVAREHRQVELAD